MTCFIPARTALAAAVAASFLIAQASGALAQSRPSGTPEPAAPAAPAAAPKTFGTRSIDVGTAVPPPVMAPDVVESRPGGCPEGPPCPGDEGSGTNAAPADCGEGKDCSKPE